MIMTDRHTKPAWRPRWVVEIESSVLYEAVKM